MICEIHRLGLLPYNDAWQLQKKFAARRAANEIPDALLFLEHPHTFTLGRSGHIENLLWDENERGKMGVTVEWVDRGGDITYHGPGQLVGYPILKLGKALSADGHLPQTDYVGYIRKIEEMIIRTMMRFGIVCGQINGVTGVWVQPDAASRCPHCPPSAKLAPSKIAAIGVKVDAHGISQHGFALNVEPNMNYFSGIVACGLGEQGVISMAELLLDPPPMDSVIDELVRQFAIMFKYDMVLGNKPSGASV